jgi:hypothetical protein
MIEGSGELITKQDEEGYDIPFLSTEQILQQLEKFGFIIDYNVRSNLPDKTIDFLATIDNLGYDRITRILLQQNDKYGNLMWKPAIVVYKSMIGNERFRLFYNEIFTMLFSFGVILSRAIGFRAPRAFIEDDAVEIIVTVILSVLAYLLFIRRSVRRAMIEARLDRPANMSTMEFSRKTLPIFICVCAASYFLMGGDCTQNILAVDYITLFSQGGFNQLWSEGYLTDIALMLPTFVLILVFFRLLTKKRSKA